MNGVTSLGELMTPVALGPLRLKNPVVRAGCFEGMSQEGLVSDALLAHHRTLAEGGVGMTTVGYCAVSSEARGFGNELWMRPAVLPGLERLVDEVHRAGALASIQLVHCGFFANPGITGQRPVGPSRKYCAYRMRWSRPMTRQDMTVVCRDFAEAARAAKAVGFDAVELHSGHGYLLSQFLSPWTNERKDEFGGTPENRMRFPLQVLDAMRGAVGPEFPILIKLNQSDGFAGGMGLAEALETAAAFEAHGATGIIPSCGFTARTPFYMLRGALPVAEMAAEQSSLVTRLGMTLFGRLMVPHHEYEELFLFEGARRFMDRLTIPVIYIGGVSTRASVERVLSAGFPAVQIGRALIRDPHLVSRLGGGEAAVECDHCNRCVAAMDGGGVRCVTADEGKS